MTLPALPPSSRAEAAAAGAGSHSSELEAGDSLSLTALSRCEPVKAQSRVLLIDDDEQLGKLLTRYLANHGYAVVAVCDPLSGLKRLASEPWDAVLLDVMLPKIDGFEVLRRVRATSTVPVLMLSARADEADRIVGLETGADDYIPKNFSSRELVARIRATLRRSEYAIAAASQAAEQQQIKVGELSIDLEAHQVFMRGQEVCLTAVEFNLLVSLARAAGRVLSRDQLISEVRARKAPLQDRSIDVHISSLRRKLGEGRDCQRYIKTVRTIGYRLVCP